MKILHLVYDHTSNPWVGGGGATRVYELSKRLSQRGHELIVISGNYPSAKDFKEGNLSYRFLGSKKNYILSTFSYAFNAARFLRRHSNDFDLIVEDFAPWNPVFSRFLSKRPVILHINHKEGLNILKRWFIFGIPFYLIEAFYPKLFKHVTALSEGTKKKIRISSAVVIPAGINEDLLSEKDIEKEANYILYIGRLHIKNKGLDTLLNAMKGLDVRLLIVGRGRDEDKLRKMAERLKLKNVELLGFLSEEEKIKVLRKARFLLLPSRFEGWGIVLLESASFSKPVIVSDIPELFFACEGGFGISFKTGDSNDLRDKISLLLKDKDLCEEMGRKARLYVKDYTWDRIAGEYEEFLQKVLRHDTNY